MSDTVLPKTAMKVSKISMENPNSQKVSIRLPLADYGWLVRYAESHDMTVSQVIRKAVRMMRHAIAKRDNISSDITQQ